MGSTDSTPVLDEPLQVERAVRLFSRVDTEMSRGVDAEIPLTPALDLVEIHRVVAQRDDGIPTEQRMEFRMGVHVGEIRIEGERIYGSDVNVAARLEGLAERGGICLSAAAHDQVRRLPGVEGYALIWTLSRSFCSGNAVSSNGRATHAPVWL